ncbi:hypothetical protein KC906_00710 [Candidatus Kaiserbacteria bacterium]|nr:hypothetical protein [Candidatus Kaiserbacteria bacterium]MCB9812585.1 hypothetical protein [Candidatus Nomurabacteria bacterium]
MKYVLDFDDTLYDAKRFKQQVAADGTAHLLFTPEIWQLYDVQDYLHTDTVDWLASKQQEDLFILTAAMTSDGKVVMAYQQEKLRCSKLGAVVFEIIFSAGEKGVETAEIASRFPPSEPIIFIDDKIEQCLSVKATVPQAHCFLMVRDPSVIGEAETVRSIDVVHSLADVDAKIREL